MIEILMLLLLFAAGGALAVVWLTGLWLDMRALSRGRRSRTRLVLGALARLTIVAAGFYLVIVSGDHWSHPAAALAGFIVVRQVVLARARRRSGAGGGTA